MRKKTPVEKLDGVDDEADEATEEVDHEQEQVQDEDIQVNNTNKVIQDTTKSICIAYTDTKYINWQENKCNTYKWI